MIDFTQQSVAGKNVNNNTMFGMSLMINGSFNAQDSKNSSIAASTGAGRKGGHTMRNT